MKVFISCDMEGVSGVSNWDQTFIKGNAGDFARARRQMTLEVNAAVQGAVDARAREVIVRDAHGGGASILVEQLHPSATLITGSPVDLSMAGGLHESFAAAFLIGYHARAGQPGVLNHTYTGSITAFTVNGRVLGEAAMTAAAAGSFGVPVALVVGDDVLAREVSGWGPVRTVVTKESQGRYAATCRMPQDVLDDIRCQARLALDPDLLASLRPLVIESPVTIEVSFAHTHLADQAARAPAAVRTGPLSAATTASCYLNALRAALAMISLGFS